MENMPESIFGLAALIRSAGRLRRSARNRGCIACDKVTSWSLPKILRSGRLDQIDFSPLLSFIAEDASLDSGRLRQ
jgi:hypothetical protein